MGRRHLYGRLYIRTGKRFMQLRTREAAVALACGAFVGFPALARSTVGDRGNVNAKLEVLATPLRQHAVAPRPVPKAGARHARAFKSRQVLANWARVECASMDWA